MPYERVAKIFTEFLHKKGLRLTGERMAVLQAALNDEEHFDAERLWQDVNAQGQDVSRATVYRTVALLVECGLLREIDTGERKSRFEPVAGREHHEHLVCNECGKIIEFHEPKMEDVLPKICTSNDFEMTGHYVRITGVCGECRSRRKD